MNDLPTDSLSVAGILYRNGIFVKGRHYPSGWSSIPQNIDTKIHVRDVKDGLSNTLMVSEKGFIEQGTPFADDMGWASGYSGNTLRGGMPGPARDFSLLANDVPVAFGSAHPHSMNALFADGSVRSISYTIPDRPEVCQAWYPQLAALYGIQPLPSPPYKPYSINLTLFQRLCHRSDGSKVQLTEIDN